MALKELKIENFRGISSLKLQDLPKIVVFGGRNSCGKTTVLESILMLILGESCRHLLVCNQYIRSLMPLTMEDVKETFYKGDFITPIRLSGILENDAKISSKYWLQHKLNYSISTEKPMMFVSEDTSRAMPVEASSCCIDSQSSVNSMVNEYELCAEFKTSSRVVTSKATYNGKGAWEIQQQKDASFIEGPAAFLPAFGQGMLEIDVIKKMFNEGGDACLLSVLKKIDSRVESLHIVEKRIMVRLQNINPLFPIQILGDGIAQLSRIIIHLILCKDNGICCIDEIGNGLHYSACELLWNLIFDFAREHSIQLFVTTHREDVLRVFAEVCTKPENGCVSSAYINLIRNPVTNDLEEFRYQPSDLLTAMDAELEVR